MSTPENRSAPTPDSEPAPRQTYASPEEEQELRADLEATWQDESKMTARSTDFADEVDGRLGTRHRARPESDTD